MKVLFFGRLKEVVGTSELEIDGIDDLKSLKKILVEKFPRLGREVFSVAVNYEIVNENTSLGQDDEVALLPPIAGG